MSTSWWGDGVWGQILWGDQEESAASPDIAVPAGALNLTTYAPVLVRGIKIPVAGLALTTYAPTVVSGLIISVPAATLTVSTFAPGLVRNIPIPVRAMTITGRVPLVVKTVDTTVPTGSLHLSTFAPGVTFIHLDSCSERFGPKLYFWEPSYLERPEDTFLRATDWENAGYQGLKFVQGFILEADTEGDTRQIMIQGDQNDIELITINHDGQIQKPYSLNQPTQAHLLRILPMDTSVHWRLFHVRWVYEPAPEFAKEWKTQGTDHDIPGYQFLKDIYIAHNSTVDITLNITVDGSLFTYTIPNSGGQFKKDYLLLALDAATGLALKGTLFTYELTSSAPFQLFQRDCEVRVHAWAGGDYMVKLPFGDTSRVNGARI